MKNKIILTLVLLFTSCEKQDVYEFERISNEYSWGIKLKANFQIIDEEGFTLYNFETEKSDDIKKVQSIKFYDNKRLLLFETDSKHKFLDSKGFENLNKTKIVTRALLEKVHRMEFKTRPRVVKLMQRQKKISTSSKNNK